MKPDRITTRVGVSGMLGLVLVLFAACADSAPDAATIAGRHVAGWTEMGMWLPDEEQVAFFRDHLAETSGVLAKALETPNPEVRQRAAYVIGELGPDANELGPEVTARLRAEPDRLVRIYVIEALQAIEHRDAEAIAILETRFAELADITASLEADSMPSAAEERVSVAAALFALSPHTDERAMFLDAVTKWLDPPVGSLTGDDLEAYWDCRWTAVLALEDLPGASDAIPLLESMLEETDTKPWVGVHVPRVIDALQR